MARYPLGYPNNQPEERTMAGKKTGETRVPAPVPLVFCIEHWL